MLLHRYVEGVYRPDSAVSRSHAPNPDRDEVFPLPAINSPTLGLWNLNLNDGPPCGPDAHARDQAWRKSIIRGRCKSSAQYSSTTVQVHVLTLGEVQYLTIDLLPDNVLLGIFKVYVNEATQTQEWHALVHVCRRWRDVVFSSPRHLDLRLVCTTRTPVRARLAIWPAFPIAVTGSVDPVPLVVVTDNIMAALENKDRVCRIDLKRIPNPLLVEIAAALEEPFSALTDMALESNHKMELELPNTLLGGFAPRLRSLRLSGVPFPAIPEVLLSAAHLVSLQLWDIPHSAYISPDDMVTCLSTLMRLNALYLGFRSPLSRTDRTTPRLPSPTLVVLPALFTLEFKGVSEYFEDLAAKIDAPQLNTLLTFFFNQLIFEIPQLVQFICRTDELKAPNRADVFFHDDFVKFSLFPKTQTANCGGLGIVIESRVSASDWQLSSVAQLCNSFLFPLSTLENIAIYDPEGLSRFPFESHWRERMDDTQWLELLHPFSAVKNLFLSHRLVQYVLPALRYHDEEGLGITEVLPALQNLLIEKFVPWLPVREEIREFVDARVLSGHPMSVYRWPGFRELFIERQH